MTVSNSLVVLINSGERCSSFKNELDLAITESCCNDNHIII